MKKAIITVGIQCSGKSTWARQFLEDKTKVGEKWIIACRDDIRIDLHQAKRNTPFAWKTWNWKWEDEVTQLQMDAIERHSTDSLVSGVIVADMNLKEQRRTQLTTKLQQLGFEVEEQHFEVTFEEACRRDAARLNGVGYSAIASNYERWIKQFKSHEIYVPDVNKQKAIIVDVDGTVAQMNGRSPFDWERVGEDLPCIHVIDVVKGMYNQGYRVIFLSGRSAICFNLTKIWLDVNVGIPFELHMRTAGDIRKDTIIKQELFDKYICHDFNVLCAFDDRPVCCRLWRELGIPVLQLGNPYIEF